ncbi:hypothetical protein AJ78_03417 [Emergomyces pasteurianus Ep9510]|uniref:Methyltransferase domain-containing protein n=1 Tax=Emergomyces pasteurianus Ep9510 TaxID=1447872 RepID=A0A1J9PK46_9EURO|nr:hypothetical protein AJ78_03417 [Emergomyces pasteurianus Ep9510]
MASNLPTATSPPADGREVKYVDTIDAYDQWAEVYDTDGNFLQALDTLEMQSLLPKFLSLLDISNNTAGLKIIDLGCGTGRNTIPLIRAATCTATIVGLEPSRKMLQIARERVARYLASVAAAPAPATKEGENLTAGIVAAIEQQQQQQQVQLHDSRVSLHLYNLLDYGSAEGEGTPGSVIENADGVISTLVMEHVPLDKFFGAVGGMLKKSGVLLVTNMHSEMGSISQAGFVDPKTGVKIRPTSYAHTVAEMVEAAEDAGFEVVGHIKEVKVDEDLAAKLGRRAEKWIGVQAWYGGCFRKK